MISRIKSNYIKLSPVPGKKLRMGSVVIVNFKIRRISHSVIYSVRRH